MNAPTMHDRIYPYNMNILYSGMTSYPRSTCRAVLVLHSHFSWTLPRHESVMASQLLSRGIYRGLQSMSHWFDYNESIIIIITNKTLKDTLQLVTTYYRWVCAIMIVLSTTYHRHQAHQYPSLPIFLVLIAAIALLRAVYHGYSTHELVNCAHDSHGIVIGWRLPCSHI